MRINSCVSKLVANLALEVLEILAALGDLRLQRFHGGHFVLLADGVQPLDDLGVDVNAIILGALHEQGLIDQIAKQVLFLRRDLLANLFRSAFRAGVPRFTLEGGSRVRQVLPRDDLVVHAGDNFLDHGALRLRARGNAEAREKKRKNQPFAWFHRERSFSSLSLRFQRKQHVSDAFGDPAAPFEAHPERAAGVQPQAFLLRPNEFHEIFRRQRRLRVKFNGHFVGAPLDGRDQQALGQPLQQRIIQEIAHRGGRSPKAVREFVVDLFPFGFIR